MSEKVVIEDFKPFVGVSCEPTATGCLLKHIGIELSEPMIFGLGEGLGYIFWNMKTMNFPFLGGRIKQDLLTENIARNLNLRLEVRETSSAKKAWNNVKTSIDAGIPVGVKLDSYYLDYFSDKFHFAGHYVAMYGYDDESVYLIDTQKQGGKVKTSLESFEAARNAKGPMSSRNLSFMIHNDGKDYNLQNVIIKAIRDNASDYLNPPIKNIGCKGILKTSVEVKKWFKSSKDVKNDFKTTAMLMEDAGTGGALFRNLYKDFLKECYEILLIKELREAYLAFEEIATLWTRVSTLFDCAGETEEIGCINDASEILVDLSEKERRAMEGLSRLKTR